MTDTPASDRASAPSAPQSAEGSAGSRPPRRRRLSLWWRRFRLLPRPLRITTYLVVALVLVLVAGLLTGYTVARRSFPQADGSVGVPGLGSRVEVVRGDRGIPQIYADTTSDLMYAQGYVHAQDRFFEMDVRRHATAGRLAELFGESALETDLYVRTMGWRRVAEQELSLLDPSTRAALDSYADGVNAYIDDRSPGELALEYTVLGLTGLDYDPEPWTPVDSLAWLKAMAWDLRGNMSAEIQRVLSTTAVGRRRAEQLFPPYPYDEHAPIVRQGAVVDQVFEQDATTSGTRDPVRPPPGPAVDELRGVQRGLQRMPAWFGRGDGLGSNSWVVSGEYTETGAPMLANDPHLGASLPGVWTQVGLHCRTVGPQCPYDVSGFSFAGVPGVIIGHNSDIAWGFTNLGPDVTDLYVEKVRGDQWRYAGRWRPLRTRTETVEVAGGEDVELEVRSTKHGPIISGVDELVADVADQAQVPGRSGESESGESETGPSETGRAETGGGEARGFEYAVSLSWTALTPTPTADAILALNRASDWQSFRDAVADFAVPAQNIVYADREGNIGYQAPGRVPIRKSGNDGRTPSAGWRPENDWTGEVVPFDALPNVLNPEEGFVVTANQAVIGREYPYFLTDDWARGYRSQRIRDLIGGQISRGDRFAVDDLAEMQLDVSSPLAPVLVPHLLRIDLAEGYYSDGQRLLGAWDFEQHADSAAAAYFNVVWRQLLRLTFHDELPEAAYPDGGQRWFAVVTDLLERSRDAFWDDVATDERETRDDVLRRALREARDELTARQAVDAEEWTWGDLHRLELRSSTLGESGIAAVEGMFNRGGWEVGGGSALVNATAWDAAEGYGVTAAPSMRMVVSLADFDESRWINLTGVSGHAFHENYTDQTELWVDGETLPWAFSREAVEEAGEDTLVLEPAPEES